MDLSFFEKREYIHDAMRRWDVPFLNQSLEEESDLSHFVINDSDDIVIRSLLNINLKLLKASLKRNWDFKASKIPYMLFATKIDDVSFCEELYSACPEKKKLLCVKQFLTQDTILHSACQSTKSDDIIKWIDDKINLWDEQNNSGQIPLHTLLRRGIITEDALNIITEKKLNWQKKDFLNISCSDIISSYMKDSYWMEQETHQKLVNFLKEKNEIISN